MLQLTLPSRALGFRGGRTVIGMLDGEGLLTNACSTPRLSWLASGTTMLPHGTTTPATSASTLMALSGTALQQARPRQCQPYTSEQWLMQEPSIWQNPATAPFQNSGFQEKPCQRRKSTSLSRKTGSSSPMKSSSTQATSTR